MKKLLSVSIIMSMMFLASCGGSSKKTDESASTQTETTSASTQTETNVWDENQNQFEKLADDFIVQYKKVIQGDVDASGKLELLDDEAEALAEKIEAAEAELSEAQKQRYQQILDKVERAIGDSESVVAEEYVNDDEDWSAVADDDWSDVADDDWNDDEDDDWSDDEDY